jgi:hypothetical protein
MRPTINPDLRRQSENISSAIERYLNSGGVIDDCSAPGRPLDTITHYNGRAVNRATSARGGSAGRAPAVYLSATERPNYLSTSEFCRSAAAKDSLLAISRTHWWRGVHLGTYPSPDFVIGRTALWRREKIVELAEKLAKRES